MGRNFGVSIWLWAVACATGVGRLGAADLDSAPVYYATAPDNNPVARLQLELDTGRAKLAFDREKGYLPAILKALEVPVSSQVLVFSKTSLQRNRIAPKTPRAIYFNDEVYVGYCQSGEVMEFSAADPALGTVFYTLEQQAEEAPRFKRQTEACLICHGSSATKGFPGHLARSVYADTEGQPIFSLGTSRVEHSTPLEKRWGGWYVTGSNPGREHRGNMILPKNTRHQPRKNPHGTECSDLKEFFATEDYLSPHSDLVALMVFEHQTEVHNRLTRVALETQLVLHQQQEFDRILGRKEAGNSDSTSRHIDSACESLVQYLFFAEEAALGGQVKGFNSFASEFSKKGPHDAMGRTLRDFDLKDRLFRYPLSYMILSHSFEQLPVVARDVAIGKVVQVIREGNCDKKYAHLTTAIRRDISEVLAGMSPLWKERLAKN